MNAKPFVALVVALVLAIFGFVTSASCQVEVVSTNDIHWGGLTNGGQCGICILHVRQNPSQATGSTTVLVLPYLRYKPEPSNLPWSKYPHVCLPITVERNAWMAQPGTREIAHTHAAPTPSRHHRRNFNHGLHGLRGLRGSKSFTSQLPPCRFSSEIRSLREIRGGNSSIRVHWLPAGP